MKSIILASKSPRRCSLLKQAGIPFTVLPVDADETFPSYQSPSQAVCTIAYNKGYAALTSLNKDIAQNRIIISADTIVDLNGEILTKPIDKDDAIATLKKLSGKQHNVFTGVCIFKNGEQVSLFRDCTKVYFRDLSESEILSYVESKEPMDKAGSYAIQGLGASFVTKIEGELDNVIGLPVEHLLCELKRLGYFES